MKKIFFLLFLCAIGLSAQARRKKFIGETSFFNGLPSSGTLFKFVEVVYDGGTPIKLIRGAITFKLYYKCDDGDFEVYSTNNPNFTFGIKDDCVVEMFYMNGMNNVAIYNANPSNNGDGSGMYNGTFGGYDNGGSSSSTYTKCKTCEGSTICTSCNGNGGEYVYTDTYTGSGNKSWIPCPSCRGSKKCFMCHGTGRY